jgi:hypothetical protein
VTRKELVAIINVLIVILHYCRNAAVCGALLGCVVGYKGLPPKWLEGLVHKEFLEQKVNKLLMVMGLL